MSRYLEEFHPGEVLFSAGRTITEAEAIQFAALTGDSERTVLSAAADGEMHARTAPEALIFCISTGLAAGQDRSQIPDLIAFLSVERMRFLEPVLMGDTIRLKQTVESAEPVNEHTGLLTMAWELLNQNDSIALRYSAKFLVRRRPRSSRSSK